MYIITEHGEKYFYIIILQWYSTITWTITRLNLDLQWNYEEVNVKLK